MTILPKKKPQQAAGGAEVEAGESSPSAPHHNHSGHLQAGEGSRSPLYLSSQSPPPCWPPPPAPAATREEKQRPALAAATHYEELSESGPSHVKHIAHNHANHGKRRYRCSPLRSVRPKHREHRGSTSPNYPSTSSGGWSVASGGHSHSIPVIPPVLPPVLSPQAGPSAAEEESSHNGYNSGDEYEPYGWNLTLEQWEEKERWFEKKMKKKGLVIKKMSEDGACLFRSISDQVYGNEDMHASVRQHCLDYITSNEEAFSPFVSENFQMYVQRKRRDDCFGNHIEIAAMSEMYNRVIEVYCYSVEPINIFQGCLQTDNEPIRLTYHKGTHYNSLVDPYKATVGVGLGLPGYQPGQADKNLLKEATRISENTHLEQAMLEDKIRATDFEATSEALEEQVVHESYLQWLRDNEQRAKGQSLASSSGHNDRGVRGVASPLHPGKSSPLHPGKSSPLRSPSTHGGTDATEVRSPPRVPRTSPSPRSPCASSSSTFTWVSDLDPAIPGSSKDPNPSYSVGSSCSSGATGGWGNFVSNETASSFLTQLPLDVFGLTDYTSAEADVLAQVLAASQQEYLEALKAHKEEVTAAPSSPSPPS